nr:hypothetical protein [Suid alphaherpesvirus 1]
MISFMRRMPATVAVSMSPSVSGGRSSAPSSVHSMAASLSPTAR